MAIRPDNAAFPILPRRGDTHGNRSRRLHLAVQAAPDHGVVRGPDWRRRGGRPYQRSDAADVSCDAPSRWHVAP